MIIVHTKTGDTLIQNKDFKNWDDVPEGIASLEIGTFANELLTLPKCDKYFYSTEARTSISVGDGSVSGKPVITAHIIGGIIGENALVCRIDTRGHITIKYINKNELSFRESVYK
jgi:hypothetical protein